MTCPSEEIKIERKQKWKKKQKQNPVNNEKLNYLVLQK